MTAKTLPEWFQMVREGLGPYINPKYHAALDEIAEMQHEIWECECRPDEPWRARKMWNDPRCLALRAACRGGKG